MSNVMLAIGGRTFTLSCAPGEEAHVAELARMVDARAAASGGIKGQSETRMLLLAALMLADDLHDARRELALSARSPEDEAAQDAAAERAERLADRLEALARQLEAGTS